MRQSISSIFILFLIILVGSCGGRNDKGKKSLYAEIDSEIEKVEEYDRQKESRIATIKENISKETSSTAKRELTNWLITEYEAYNSDSALKYININLENPEVKANPYLETLLLIKKGDVTAHAGLFGEAHDILSKVNKNSLDTVQLEQYYSAYCDLYQYQSEYATDSEFGRTSEQMRQLYIDSITMVSLPTSFNYVMYHAADQARKGDFEDAEELLLDNIKKYKKGDRKYSILTSILADIYLQQNNKEKYNQYIGESVISDLQGAIKENMAIRALATICYEDGDLERADRYLRQSFADANFYSARMRNAQSSRMLPVIGEAYIAQQKQMHRSLTLFIIFISILAGAFIFLSIFAFKQVKKVRANNRKKSEMLEKVSKLTQSLTQVNEELSQANKELKASNALRAEYGILFMEYCSLAISALQQYQQSLKVSAMQGNMKALVKKIDSSTIESKTLSEFYSKFDDAIMHLYPQFVDKFNSLLKPEERILLKPGEILNTELRVFALLKIGFSDSEKIAQFLRCSLSTVYTYRSKMKKKAQNPDTFEQDLMEI